MSNFAGRRVRHIPAPEVEVERLRRGLELILEFGDPDDDEGGCREIADEALGNVVGGPWFSPENVDG